VRRLIAIVGFSLFLSGLSLLASSSPSYAATTTTRVTANDSRTVRIIAGSDRYETAVLVSRAGFPQGAPAVVIARGDDYADALCSAPLAYAYGGPLLLTPAGGLPDTVVAEIRRLNPSQVFLVGIGDGSSTILRQVRQVTRAASITTLVGRDRYETAALVADQLRVKAGAPSKVVIAPGDTFADALSVGPLAAVNHWPILYTPQHGTLPRVTRDEIAKLGVASALEIGTYARLELRDVDRIVGVDRYDTCAKVARYSLDHGLNTAHVAFATGETFPDGLAAAPYIALDKGVLLLTKGAMTTTPVREFLTPRAAGVRILEAVGLSTVPAGPWVTSGTTTPPASGQDNTEPDPGTTETPTVPPSSTTTTTTARPTTTTTQFTPPETTTTTGNPPAATTTTRPPSTTTTTLRASTTTTTAKPTTTTTTPSGTISSGPIALQSNRTYSNLAISGSGSNMGIWGSGLSNTVLSNVSVNGGNYGMKIGSGPISSFTADRLTINAEKTGIYLDNVHDTVLTNLNVYAPRDASTNQTHAIYIESDVINLTIKNSTFRGGSGYTVHLYHSSGISQRITFENCVIDASQGRYPVVISDGFDNVRFLNCTFIGNSAGQVFQFSGGNNILVDGFTASGCQRLISGSATNTIVRNGTYDGPAIGTADGVTVANVTLR